MHMKFVVPWLFLSEILAYCLPLLICFYEDHNKGCPMRKVKQFSKHTFGDIFSQRLTKSPYI